MARASRRSAGRARRGRPPARPDGTPAARPGARRGPAPRARRASRSRRRPVYGSSRTRRRTFRPCFGTCAHASIAFAESPTRDGAVARGRGSSSRARRRAAAGYIQSEKWSTSKEPRSRSADGRPMPLHAVRSACESGSRHVRSSTSMPGERRADPLRARGDSSARTPRSRALRRRPRRDRRATRGCSSRSRAAGARAARRRRRSSRCGPIVEHVEVGAELAAVGAVRQHLGGNRSRGHARNRATHVSRPDWSGTRSFPGTLGSSRSRATRRPPTKARTVCGDSNSEGSLESDTTSSPPRQRRRFHVTVSPDQESFG